ncbi:MAG: F0F1 ATP synthase subunit delta [Bacteroidales bacterium]|nr:F0F1 ATP synthase subunit delta [Bacteroidales bacterium]
MDAGLIATRYARALLLYAREERTEAPVYEDAQKLLDALQDQRSLTSCIEGLSQTLRHFVALVIRNKRVEYLPAILHNFRVLYRLDHGITRAWLTTATEDPELAGKLTTLMKLQGFTRIDFRTEVNPDLIGGFILQIEDKRLDASIASQLRTIRKEWEEKNSNNRKNG